MFARHSVGFGRVLLLCSILICVVMLIAIFNALHILLR